jgi:RES domain
LSAPITRDSHTHIEYVPTQVVTEYFRFTFAEEQGLPIDGIVYPSSRMKGKNACVLFMDHRESLERLTFLPASLETDKVKQINPLKGL